MQTMQPFYATNYICLQARGIWKLAYINEKKITSFYF